MASSVFYKFKSQRDESRVSFDGTGISVFDLKKEIILANNLGKANDFDLHIYDSGTNEEYNDDSHIIPRSSTVIAKRLPAARAGKGKAALYVGNSMPSAPSASADTKGKSSTPNTWNRMGPMTKRFDRNEPERESGFESQVEKMVPKAAAGAEDEADALKAMFQATEDHWKETGAKMQTFRKVDAPKFPGSLRKSATPHQHSYHPYQNQRPSDRPVPPSYVCYRCGQKGHFIQDCPTNNDREFDNKPRIKRTTGIPRSFLKTVTQPGDGQLSQGVMVTPEGSYVIAQPDNAAWQKQRQRTKVLTADEVREQPAPDPTMVCPLCQKIFHDPVRTPCCSKLYCEECIHNLLLERDFVCPGCGAKIASLDKLLMDKPMRTKVNDYIEKQIRESAKEVAEGAVTSGGPSRNGTPGLNSAAPESSSAAATDADYTEHQPGNEPFAEEPKFPDVPQLQAQIAQLTVMLQSPTLPQHVRQQTQFQLQQLQTQVNQAQMVMAVAAAMNGATGGFDMNSMMQPLYPTPQQQQNEYLQQQQQQQRTNWTNPYPVNPSDSAYQRLPVNSRRRNHRDRPSDYYEVAGQPQRQYWE